MRAQPRFDRRIFEVEEVAGVVPHEAVLNDGAAIAAGLRLGLEHERVTAALAPPVREAEARDAGADDDRGHLGTAWLPELSPGPMRASSLSMILRVIAIAQP